LSFVRFSDFAFTGPSLSAVLFSGPAMSSIAWED
jgi:hypothetical protein